jgi:hypothetical protein
VKVALHDVAHSRSGDKGTLNTVSLIAYDERWYPVLCELVTPGLVRGHLGERFPGEVVRHRMDNLAALLFVCRRAPGDTVTTSLYLDAHAKGLSSELLELVIDVPPERVPDLSARRTDPRS